MLPELLSQLLAGELARVVSVDHLECALQVLIRENEGEVRGSY